NVIWLDAEETFPMYHVKQAFLPVLGFELDFSDSLPSRLCADRGALQSAMALAVSEVNYLTDREPDYQTDPVVHAERVHQAGVPNDTENGDQWHPRRAEGARSVGMRAAHHEYARAHDHEGEQGADVGHMSDDFERQETAQRGHE